MVNSVQDNCKFLTLALFGLSHFKDVQRVACEFLPQLVEHLTIVQILLDVRHNYTLFNQFVVNPIDESLEEIPDVRHIQAHWLDY